jgi:hypothetical protein
MIYKPRRYNKKYGEFLLDKTFYNNSMKYSNDPLYIVNAICTFKTTNNGEIYELKESIFNNIF